MKYAILADVHANLEALQAVLADSREQGCAHYAFLGDFVGYAADPKACLEMIRSLNASCVKGNHDEYCATDSPLDDFSPAAAKMIQWTRRQLSADERRWLNGLPLVLKVEDFTIVHATLNLPEQWGYVFERLAATASFSHQRTQVCFFGHTHVPVAFIRNNVVRGGTYSKFQIAGEQEYFINVGSVGQPRDGSSKAAYVIYDLDERSVELRRCDYDFATTQKKIRAAGL